MGSPDLETAAGRCPRRDGCRGRRAGCAAGWGGPTVGGSPRCSPRLLPRPRPCALILDGSVHARTAAIDYPWGDDRAGFRRGAWPRSSRVRLGQRGVEPLTSCALGIGDRCPSLRRTTTRVPRAGTRSSRATRATRRATRRSRMWFATRRAPSVLRTISLHGRTLVVQDAVRRISKRRTCIAGPDPRSTLVPVATPAGGHLDSRCGSVSRLRRALIEGFIASVQHRRRQPRPHAGHRPLHRHRRLDRQGLCSGRRPLDGAAREAQRHSARVPRSIPRQRSEDHGRWLPRHLRRARHGR